MISFIKLPKLEGKVGCPSLSHKNHKWTLCVHTLHTPVFPQVTFSTIHPSFSCFALRIHLRTMQTWRHHCFSFYLTLPSSPLYLGYNAILSCNHLYSVGARLFLPSFVATYNTALTLPKWAHWRLKWAPGVPLWPPSTVVGGLHFVYNVMICGHIILRIIIKYIAYYHIAELSAHASIVNTLCGAWKMCEMVYRKP